MLVPLIILYYVEANRFVVGTLPYVIPKDEKPLKVILSYYSPLHKHSIMFKTCLDKKSKGCKLMAKLYRCVYCKQYFPTRDLLKAHIKHRHKDEIQEFLSKIREDKIKNLIKQGVDPEEWVAGWIAAMFG